MPTETAKIPYKLQCVVVSVKTRPTCKKITLKSAGKYFCAVKKRVNISNEAHDKQRRKSIIGLNIVSSISNNGANQSDPRLAWIMFHNISCMYRVVIK